MANDIIRQVISHNNDMYGLSINGNLYKLSGSTWEPICESPEYSSYKERSLEKLVKEAIKKDSQKSPEKYNDFSKNVKNKT